MFFARPTATFLLLTVSRSRCSCVLSKARGSHVQIVIQTTPDLLLVVGGRAESQLSLDVMVHKARLSQLSKFLCVR